MSFEQQERQLLKDLHEYELAVVSDYEHTTKLENFFAVFKDAPSEELRRAIMSELSTVVLSYDLLVQKIEKLKVSSLLATKDALLEAHGILVNRNDVLFVNVVPELEALLQRLYRELRRVLQNEYEASPSVKSEQAVPNLARDLSRDIAALHAAIDASDVSGLSAVLQNFAHTLTCLDHVVSNLTAEEVAQAQQIRQYQETCSLLGMDRFAEMLTTATKKLSYWRLQFRPVTAEIKQEVERIDAKTRAYLKQNFKRVPSDPSLYMFILKQFGTRRFVRVLYPGSGADVNRIVSSIPYANKIVGLDPHGSFLPGPFRLMRKNVAAISQFPDNSFDLIILDNNVSFSDDAQKLVPDFVRVILTNCFLITPGPKYSGYFVTWGDDHYYKRYHEALGIDPTFESEEKQYVAYKITSQLKQQFSLRRAA